MARLYTEILSKVRPVFVQNPERFKAFHDRVFLLLCGIPEGGSIIVREYCTTRSIDLFYDIAEMCIIEEWTHKSMSDALLEFSSDKSVIRRSVSCRPTVIRPHFYSRR